MDGASSKKPPSGGGVIQANSSISVASANVEKDQPATKLKKVKTKRTNWAYGEKAAQLHQSLDLRLSHDRQTVCTTHLKALKVVLRLELRFALNLDLL